MRRLAFGLVALAVLVIPAGSSTAAPRQSCVEPTVNALTFGEAAVSRPALAAPSEYPVSNVYSLVEQVTKPAFTYAEAGPQYAGAFEALLPPATPPPPRAVSAYPAEDIPDEDDEDWGGASHTEVSAIFASATSSGAKATGAGSSTADSSRSWVVSRVDCDVVTIVAGWEANNVVLAPGATAEQMGETVTLVVGPDGASADVETTLVGASGVSAPSEGRPLDPFTDPTRENGGPTLEAGEPRTTAGDDAASASGGGFHFFFGDPETGQGAGYSLGSVNATIDVLGPLVAVEIEGGPAPTAVVSRAPGATAAPAAELGTTSAATGAPPAPSEAALAAAETVAMTDELVSVVSVERRIWLPLFGLLGLVAVTASLRWAVLVGRDDYATLDWVVVKLGRFSARFAAVYLRW